MTEEISPQVSHFFLLAIINRKTFLDMKHHLKKSSNPFEHKTLKYENVPVFFISLFLQRKKFRSHSFANHNMSFPIQSSRQQKHLATLGVQNCLDLWNLDNHVSDLRY